MGGGLLNTTLRMKYTPVPGLCQEGDNRHCESRSPKGRQPATPADGARAVPAGGGSSPPLPGGLGIMSAGTTTGA